MLAQFFNPEGQTTLVTIFKSAGFSLFYPTLDIRVQLIIGLHLDWQDYRILKFYNEGCISILGLIRVRHKLWNTIFRLIIWSF